MRERSRSRRRRETLAAAIIMITASAPSPFSPVRRRLCISLKREWHREGKRKYTAACPAHSLEVAALQSRGARKAKETDVSLLFSSFSPFFSRLSAISFLYVQSQRKIFTYCAAVATPCGPCPLLLEKSRPPSLMMTGNSF